MKALITGAGGFVGRHLTTELTEYGCEVVGLDVVSAEQDIQIVDLLDQGAVKDFIQKQMPDSIFHLAAQASVAYSWHNPQRTFEVNVNGTLNLLDAIRDTQKKIRVIIIGTSDQYGLVKPDDCPINEAFPINPISPYAISKQAQENLVSSYINAYHMDIIMTRSFNHFGPGQRSGFVVSDFASAIARIEKGADPVMNVGNLDAIRDFTDVRDVVRAYRLLNEKGHTGEIYNVGSGTAHSIRDVLETLIRFARRDVVICQDPARMRPSDLPVMQSDSSKLIRHTGWVPSMTFEYSLRDTLQSWRDSISG